MAPTARMVTATVAMATEEPSRVLKKIGALLEEEQGRLRFSQLSLEKVGALVEVAARIPDESKGLEALYDVVRLSIALEDKGHRAPSASLQALLRASPAALKRLQAGRQKDKATYERFARFTSAEADRTAPRIDAAPPTSGVSLKALLPPGVGQRLEPRPKDAPPPDRPRTEYTSASSGPDGETAPSKPARRRFGVGGPRSG